MNNHSCNSCDYCYYCYYCDSCDYCYSCIYCNSCYSCQNCNYCKNLKMTEYNLFCYSIKYNDKNSFQQVRYRAFNKELGRDRYIEILEMVKNILDNQDKDLNCFWKTITQKQWQELLAIPEAKDFQIGFEFISGQKIEKKEEPMITLPNGKKFSASTVQEAMKQYVEGGG